MKKGDGCDVQVSRPKSLRVGPPSLPLRRAGTPGPRGRVAQGNPAPRLLRVGRGAPGQLAPSRAQPAPASPPAPVRPRPRRRSPSPSRRAAGAAPRSSRARGRRGSCSCPRPDPGADQQRAAAEAAAAAAAGRGGSAVGRRPPGARACDRRAPAPRSPSPRSRGARPAALGPGPSGLAQVDSPLKDADSILRSRTTSRKKGPSPRLQGCFPPGGPTGLFSQTAGVSNLSFRHPCIGGELCGPARFPHWLENMKVLLRLVCLIAVLISSLEADMCEERAERVILVSSAYEIDVRSCLLNPNERKGTIIWYKNDSKTPVSMEVDSRIHQHEDKLWFVPAKVEDSGHYYCAVRNSTYCLKVKITIKFVQHEPNLCYNTEAIFTQKLPVAADGQLVCPYMEFFKDEKNGLPEMQWHKDCKPLHLDNINFTGVTDRLIIANVTAAHEGKYTCGTFYTYLGKRYPITRVIELITIEEYKPVRPVIVSPANETMEAGLGSKLQLICNVSGHISDYVYWKWNGSSIDEEDSVLAEDYVPVENPPKRRKNTIITILNISEVESRFYLHPFTCVAKNTEGLSSAYIQLIHPVPDFRKHTIGVFVMLTVIITCSVFIYKIFKVDIVLWYRDSCYVLPKKASDGKTYDAYILYPKTPGEGSTSNSDIFVFKVLPEVLEEQCGYKLFIYGRDAYVGEDIVEVTNENIRKSRRLIIVLVPEASGLGCLGNSSEEQIAMYNAFVQDGIKVVLLELEKIQDYEKMPETIKFIKQKHGAIRWSGDFREGSQSAKTRFWKNVRYHMPVQRQPPSSRPQFLSLATRPDSKKTLQREVQVPLG